MMSSMTQSTAVNSKQCDKNKAAVPTEPRHYLKGSSSGSELVDFPSNDSQHELHRRTLTEIRIRPTHPLPIISSQHKKGDKVHNIIIWLKFARKFYCH